MTGLPLIVAFCLAFAIAGGGESAPSITPPLPYIRRSYILYALHRPESLLEHGIRDYVVDAVRGIYIGGYIRRVVNSAFGDQCIEIRACGLPEDLARFENEVLRPNNDVYWIWEIFPKHSDEHLRDLPTRKFQIIQSGRGAISGPKSNTKNDNTMDTKASSDGKRSVSSSKVSNTSSASLPPNERVT